MSVQKSRDVLVKASGNGKRIYHLPDPEDPSKPKCGKNLEYGSAYVSKSLEVLPGARCCRECDGTASYGGGTGENLATKLARIGREGER